MPALGNFLTGLLLGGPLIAGILVVLFRGRPVRLLPVTGFITGTLLWVGFCLSEWRNDPGPGALLAIPSGFVYGLAVAATYLAIGGSIVWAVRKFARMRPPAPN